MAPRRAVSVSLGAGALCLYGAQRAFVQPSASAAPVEQQARLRGVEGLSAGAASSPSSLAGSAPSFAVAGLAAAAAAVTGRAAASAVSRRAAATKKKGVRVVEGKEIPWNIFGPKAPYKGECISNETLTEKTEEPNWETCHVVMKHDKNVPYLEGQSIGIIAPGPDKKGETPAKLRLYSIASSAVGDDESSENVSLCVKRVVELDGDHCNVENDKEFPDNKVYRGVCSNHLCDMKPGDEALITGPTGAEMLLPEDPEANIIMLATGTGIAPFRSYLRYYFHDKATKGNFKGLSWLFLGVPYSASLLYDDEWKAMKEEFPDNFKYDYAVSREDKNEAGQKMYIQTKMAEYAEELWEMIKQEKTHVYMCGLKGMERGMEECFSELAEKDGLVWTDYAKTLKKAGRYHVEVY